MATTRNRETKAETTRATQRRETSRTRRAKGGGARTDEADMHEDVLLPEDTTGARTRDQLAADARAWVRTLRVSGVAVGAATSRLFKTFVASVRAAKVAAPGIPAATVEAATA